MRSSSGGLARIENSCRLANKQRVDMWRERTKGTILKRKIRDFITNTEDGLCM